MGASRTGEESKEQLRLLHEVGGGGLPSGTECRATLPQMLSPALAVGQAWGGVGGKRDLVRPLRTWADFTFNGGAGPDNGHVAVGLDHSGGIRKSRGVRGTFLGVRTTERVMGGKETDFDSGTTPAHCRRGWLAWWEILGGQLLASTTLGPWLATAASPLASVGPTG